VDTTQNKTQTLSTGMPAPSPEDRVLRAQPDPGFVEWLARSGGALLVTTYQAGKLICLGWNGAQVSILPRDFDKPMGLDIADGRLAMATRDSVTLFADDRILAHHYEHDRPGRYDVLYLPRVSYHTADLGIHDIALSGDDVWIVNTRFSCLAVLSQRFSFEPRWRPPFITDLVPEDRCHLNGMAMVDGKPAYVTALGDTDHVGGWRENKAAGGIVMHVDSNEIILRGLSMPHSPRWHDGALWLLNSGAGELLRLDPARGQADVVCALPGYLRGLTFVGPYALIGLCKIREKQIFGGLPIETRHPKLSCGVSVVDSRNGRQAGFFEFTTGCTEIFDIRFLPGRTRPSVINMQMPQWQQAVNAPPDTHYWLRPQNEIKG
jgi:uncharacterized protein (TIGR03032 family)